MSRARLDVDCRTGYVPVRFESLTACCEFLLSGKRLGNKSGDIPGRWTRMNGEHVNNQVVILSTADFDSTVWTNKQHLAVGLAESNTVIYIESLGLRQPTFSLADLKRIYRKIRSFSPRSRHKHEIKRTTVPENLRVVSPFVIPLHRFAMVRRLNKFLLHHQLKEFFRPNQPDTLWTFSPLTYGLESKFQKSVYHSVDLLHSLPKVPRHVLLSAERQLLASVDYTIASSKGVQEHLQLSGGKDVLLWENVAHTKLFSSAIGGPRHDRALFAGNLTPSKVDVRCLQSVLDHGLELVIAGPLDIDGVGPSDAISDLLKDPRVKYFGNLSLEDLAQLMASSKVGLIPYCLNEYTQGVFPMKVYEYLAAGLNVISTPLPSLESKEIVNLILAEPDNFGSSARQMCAEHNDGVIAASVGAASSHSWPARIRQAGDLIDGRES